MPTYYINTKLETDMTTYRKLLHEHFLKHYPHVLVSEQQVSHPRLELQQEIISLHSQLSLSELQEINTTIPISQHLFLTNTQLSCNYLNTIECATYNTQTPLSTNVAP